MILYLRNDGDGPGFLACEDGVCVYMGSRQSYEKMAFLKESWFS